MRLLVTDLAKLSPMPRHVWNIHEAKTYFSALLRQLAEGDEVVIARAGVPVAKLVPYRRTDNPRRRGAWRGRVWLAPDFDEWSDELDALFHGGDRAT